jgi:hypothetical protein
MALPAILGPVLGAATTFGLGSIFGGGGSSGGSAPGNAYTQFAAQMAAQNNPLTAAFQGLSLMQGALAGAIGQEATTKASAQLSILTEALQRAQKDATLQASVAGYGSGKGLDTLYNLGQAKLSTELQAPQFLAQAGSAALAGENQLANQLGITNLGVRAYQEQLRGDIAKGQADTLNSIAQTRAQNEGLLAGGAQQFESQAQLDRVKTLGDLTRTKATTTAQAQLDKLRTVGDLLRTKASTEGQAQLEQVRTLGDLARTKAATKGQLALKQFGANQAIAGTRMFA